MKYILALLLLTSCGYEPFPNEHISFDLDVTSDQPKKEAAEN